MPLDVQAQNITVRRLDNASATLVSVAQTLRANGYDDAYSQIMKIVSTVVRIRKLVVHAANET